MNDYTKKKLKEDHTKDGLVNLIEGYLSKVDSSIKEMKLAQKEADSKQCVINSLELDLEKFKEEKINLEFALEQTGKLFTQIARGVKVKRYDQWGNEIFQN